MYSNKYNFCGCSVEITTDEKLIPEGDFSVFSADSIDSDYSFQVISTDELPQKSGDALFLSDGMSVFKNDCQRWFFAYPVTADKYVTYACREDFARLYILDNHRITEHTVFTGINLPELLLEKGIGLLHCSFIEYEGQAILFAGDSGVGKSTQASLWEKYASANVINGDRAGIYIKDGVVYAGGVPYSGTSKICKNAHLPVRAVVCLSQGTENTLRRLSGIEAFTSLLGKFTYNTWDSAAVNAVSDLLTTIAENVPVYSYSCVKDSSAVQYLSERI